MNNFRQTKYQNFAGSKQGTWYMNTCDYFTFHHFPKFYRLYVLCAIGCALGLFIIKYIPYLFVIGIYFIYLSTTTTFILYRKVCKYRGYFLYPNKFIRFFKSYKKNYRLTLSRISPPWVSITGKQ